MLLQRVIMGLTSCGRNPQELRKQNVAAIKEARRAHKDACSDADGYDLIAVPEVRERPSLHVPSLSVTTDCQVVRLRGLAMITQGTTIGHNSKKIRIFTKQEYRRV
jgi:hypothetical protein